MNQAELDSWCRSIFEIEALSGVDDSLNGVQVSRSSPSAPLETVAFAVDACAESIRRAAGAGAQALFVHHGLFWGKSLRVEGALRERLALLLRHDMALYACHLPLDKHPELGNNAVLARHLGMSELEGFGEHRGHKLGFA
ncbi:MAG: Nif3-like dinuclear metal center hexameric protein, partial [Spirochaetaceae bacterium]|nr:Nif3-like dinuclear metal center hexameric protein [Spirochaetaceae bacterium]